MNISALGYCIVAALTTLLSCLLCRADGGTPVHSIFALEQVAQDVKLTLCTGDIGTKPSLVREGDSYEKVVFEDTPIWIGGSWNPVCISPEGSPISDCDAEIHDCWDCNDDGNKECWNGEGASCTSRYFVDYIDQCVYPGEVVYKLYWGPVAEVATHSDEIVVNEFIECDYGLPNTNPVLESCSVSGIGSRSATGQELLLLTMAIGLFTMLRSQPR